MYDDDALGTKLVLTRIRPSFVARLCWLDTSRELAESRTTSMQLAESSPPQDDVEDSALGAQLNQSRALISDSLQGWGHRLLSITCCLCGHATTGANVCFGVCPFPTNVEVSLKGSQTRWCAAGKAGHHCMTCWQPWQPGNWSQKESQWQLL